MRKKEIKKIARHLLKDVKINVNVITHCEFCGRRLSRMSVLTKEIVDDPNGTYLGIKGISGKFGHRTCVYRSMKII